jgi:hypothetical protein
MHRFEPSLDDVVMMDTSQSLIQNDPTYRVNQLKQMLKDRFNTMFSNKMFQNASIWLDEGVDCQFLDAQAGGGWKKAKIRLCVEIVLDEPEPEPEQISTDPNSLDSLRAELHSKQ